MLNPTFSLFKFVALETFRFFNKSCVKEAGKNFIAVSFCIFAAIEFCDLIKDFYEAFKGRPVYQIGAKESTISSQKVLKLIIITSKVSIFIAGIVNPYGLCGLKFLFGAPVIIECFSRLFGPNVNFAGNPLHLRHILSIGNAILGLPATLKTLYGIIVRIVNKTFKNRVCYEELELDFSRNRFISDKNVQFITTWNTILSRPALHFYNFCFRSLLFS